MYNGVIMTQGKIKKLISRNINTAAYEQLTVTVEIEQEVEWKDPNERDEITEELTNVVLLDFDRTLKTIMTELELVRKAGYVKHISSNVPKTEQMSKKQNKENSPKYTENVSESEDDDLKELFDE